MTTERNPCSNHDSAISVSNNVGLMVSGSLLLQISRCSKLLSNVKLDSSMKSRGAHYCLVLKTCSIAKHIRAPFYRRFRRTELAPCIETWIVKVPLLRRSETFLADATNRLKKLQHSNTSSPPGQKVLENSLLQMM